MKDFTKDILKATGMDDQVKKVEANKCPICGKDINMNDFTDALSLQEYYISGMCQKCQNEFFN